MYMIPNGKSFPVKYQLKCLLCKTTYTRERIIEDYICEECKSIFNIKPKLLRNDKTL